MQLVEHKQAEIQNMPEDYHVAVADKEVYSVVHCAEVVLAVTHLLHCYQ